MVAQAVVPFVAGAARFFAGRALQTGLSAAADASGAWSGGGRASVAEAQSVGLQATMERLQQQQTNQLIEHMVVNHNQAMFNNNMEHAQQQVAQQMQHNRALSNNAKEIATTAQEDAQSWLKSSTQKLSQTAAA